MNYDPPSMIKTKSTILNKNKNQQYCIEKSANSAKTKWIVEQQIKMSAIPIRVDKWRV